MDPQLPQNIQINMISASKLRAMSTMDKIRLILDDVSSGRIVILERGLDPKEEAQLIEHTMLKIRDTQFYGIEIQSYPRENKPSPWNILRRESNRVTVIGPADRFKTVRKEKDLISAVIS
jgi:uncharacterized protein